MEASNQQAINEQQQQGINMSTTNMINMEQPTTPTSTSATRKKRFTREEKEKITRVFNTIQGKDARMAALHILGIRDRSYMGMYNVYKRHLIKQGLKVSSPKSRYTDEEKESIMRVFTELDTAEERKAVFSMLDGFKQRSYNSLYQQYAIMSRQQSPTKRAREESNDESDDEESTIINDSKRQRTDGNDSDGLDPLEGFDQEDVDQQPGTQHDESFATDSAVVSDFEPVTTQPDESVATNWADVTIPEPAPTFFGDMPSNDPLAPLPFEPLDKDDELLLPGEYFDGIFAN
jgi:hypothetical protein